MDEDLIDEKPMRISEQEIIFSSSESVALNNSLILDSIFKYFSDVTDLKIFRLVLRSWNNAIKTKFRSDGQLQIRVRYSKIQDTYFLDLKDKCIEKTFENSLQWFNTGLTSSRLFSSNLVLIGGDLSSPHVYNFFLHCGWQIKSLGLFPDKMTPTSSTVLTKILTQLTPNLERLSIGDGLDGFTSETELYLPHLKCLELPRKCKAIHVIRSFILGARNLEKIENVSENSIDLIIDLKKLELVKEWRQPIFDRATVSQFKRLARAGPSFVKLTFHFIDHDVFGWIEAEQTILELNSILKSCIDTLEEFRVTKLPFTEQEVVEKLIVPALRKIKTLSFQELRRKVPESILTWNYPTLESLTLTSDCWTPALSSVTNGHLPSVHTLTLCDNLEKDCLEKIMSICWAVKTLRVNGVNPEFLSNLFALTPQLDILELILDKPRNFNLDAALTGMENSQCEQVRKDGKVNDENLDGLRVRPWLGSVVGLRKLAIYFAQLDKSTPPRDKPIPLPPFTIVSGLCAFQSLAPDLQVTIGYNHQDELVYMIQNKLESIVPFVDVVNYVQE